MRFYLATKNEGKRREFETLLAGTGVAVLTYEGYVDPVEGEESYADNAALKARALWEQLRAAGIAGDVLADDSGLEVAGLGGAPGVATAYYGGAGLTWAERRHELLAALAAQPNADRRARFVCYLHAMLADGTEHATAGFVDGEIATADRGSDGFSFDPIFAYPPLQRTFAELTAAEKNAVSHRHKALHALLERLNATPPA